LSDSDSSVDSILGVCLDGFNGDAWTETEGAQDDIQVGAAAGENDPGDIPWCMFTSSAWLDDVVSEKVEKKDKVRSTILASALLRTTDALNLQRAVTGAHGDSEGEVRGTSSGNGGTVDTTNNTTHGKQVSFFFLLRKPNGHLCLGAY